jgi:hypothetical protein
VLGLAIDGARTDLRGPTRTDHLKRRRSRDGNDSRRVDRVGLRGLTTNERYCDEGDSDERHCNQKERKAETVAKTTTACERH